MFPRDAVVLFLLSTAPAMATEANIEAQYSFTGTVTSVQNGGGGVQVGQKVSLRLNVNYKDNIFKQNGLHTQGTHTGGVGSGQYDLIEYQSFNSSGSTTPHFSQTFIVDKNYNGAYGYHFSAADPEVGPAFQFDVSTTKAGVVPNLLIPASIVPSNFQSATFTVYTGQPSVSYSGILN